MSFCFFDIAELEYVFRFVLAAVCGSILGLERERRAKAAGIRTYTIVAISSALMMIVSKYGFFDVIAIDGASVDVSRVAAGVVSAIGFLGAGVIFVRNENTIGVTTAAGLWATVGVGITIGAGLYFTGIVFTFFLLMLQLLFHAKSLCTFNYQDSPVPAQGSRGEVRRRDARRETCIPPKKRARTEGVERRVVARGRRGFCLFIRSVRRVCAGERLEQAVRSRRPSSAQRLA